MSKKSFVLRIDQATYAALERWAADEFRSVNGQIEMLIDQSLRNAGRKKEGISLIWKGYFSNAKHLKSLLRAIRYSFSFSKIN